MAQSSHIPQLLGLCTSIRYTVIASLLSSFGMSHDEGEILSHLISSACIKQRTPRMPRLGVACHRCSLSVEELNKAGGVTSTHAISTSFPCATGHDGPCLRLPVTLAASRSYSSPVPAMHRRHLTIVMRLGGSDSCGVGSQNQMPALSESNNPRGHQPPACMQPLSARRATRSEEDASNVQARPFLVG